MTTVQFAARRLDNLYCFIGFDAADQCNSRAGLGERDCHGLAKARVGAGNDRYLAS